MGSRAKSDMVNWSVASECIEMRGDALPETIDAIERSIWSIFAQIVRVPMDKVCAFSREEGISLTQALSCIRLTTATSSEVDSRTKQEILRALDDFNKLKSAVLIPPTATPATAGRLELLHIARAVKATIDACCMILISGFTWEQLEPPRLIID